MTISQNSNSGLVWISPHDKLPDTCCVCGMFTDNRSKVKHVELREVLQAGESGGVTMIRIVSLFLGPIGWLVSAMIQNGDEEQLKTVKLKSKISIPQCRLCSVAGGTEVVDSMESPKRFAFRTHPEFKRRFESINRGLPQANP